MLIELVENKPFQPEEKQKTTCQILTNLIFSIGRFVGKLLTSDLPFPQASTEVPSPVLREVSYQRAFEPATTSRPRLEAPEPIRHRAPQYTHESEPSLRYRTSPHYDEWDFAVDMGYTSFTPSPEMAAILDGNRYQPKASSSDTETVRLNTPD